MITAKEEYWLKSAKCEWPQLKVAELERKGILLVQDGNHGEYRPRPDEFGTGETAFIRASDMADGRILFESADRINDVALKRICKGIGQGGDVIFSHKGTVGKLAIAPLGSPPFVCSPQTTFWRALNGDILDRTFLYYFMQSREFRDQWFVRKGETDMADYVSLTAQRQLVVALPDITDQRAIAYMLGLLDDKMELNRQMNHTLEAMAQAIFKSWFLDFDPVNAKAEGKKPYGMTDEVAALFPSHFDEKQIPVGWRSGNVTDLATYMNGKNFTKDASGTGRMVVRIAELNSGPGVSTIYNDVEASSENIAFPGDLLFSWSGSLDVYRWHRDEALINQHIFKVIPQDFPQWFVHYHLHEAMPLFQGIASDKATTMGHINREHLAQAEVVLPSDKILKAADQIISPLYDRMHSNEREAITLAHTLDTLLPKLLSGEIRVNQAAKLVEKAV